MGSVRPVREQLSVAGHVVEVEYLRGADPSAPTVVFLHEALGCIDLWRDFPRRVVDETGCDGVVWSRWGYGRSEPRHGPWPFDYHEGEALEALPDLLDRLGISDHVLWGHSDGATIALLNAGLAPADGLLGVISVAGHVVVEPAGPGAMGEIAVRFSDGDLRDRLGRYHDDVDTVFGEWLRIWTDPGFADWDIRPRIGSDRATLVVQGRNDEYATPDHVQWIVDAVGPAARGVLLDGIGHQPMFEAPEELVALTADFLAEVR